jgi:hypothetical protein
MVGATGPFVYVSASASAREYLVWKAKKLKTMFTPPPPLESSPKIAGAPCVICFSAELKTSLYICLWRACNLT